MLNNNFLFKVNFFLKSSPYIVLQNCENPKILYFTCKLSQRLIYFYVNTLKDFYKLFTNKHETTNNKVKSTPQATM